MTHEAGRWVLWHWYIGLIEGMLNVAGAKGAKVSLRKHDAEGAWFECVWS